MAVWFWKTSLTFLLVIGKIWVCEGAKVQLFKDADFKGEMMELNSSAVCTKLPTSFQNLNGSIRTTGCVVVYQRENCLKKGWVYIHANLFGDGYLVNSEESQLFNLHYKYHKSKGPYQFLGNSIRDCTDMEIKPTVNFDYYEESPFSGKMVQLKDICKCTNLPQPTFQHYTYRSANTYGNCFKIFKANDCAGEPDFTTSLVRIGALHSNYPYIEPCELPQHCTRSYTITNLTFVSSTVVWNLTRSTKQVETTFAINNGSVTLEQNHDFVMELSEIAKFEVASEFALLDSRNIFRPSFLGMKTHLKFPENSSTTLKSAILTAFQGLQSNWNETFMNGLETTREFRVRNTLNMLPCSQYELTQFVEMTEVEIQYPVQFRVSGELRNGSGIKSQAIRSNMNTFRYLNSTDDYSVWLETSIKLKLSYGSTTGVNVIVTPIAECRRRFITLGAKVIDFQPVPRLLNISNQIQRHAITTKTIIVNNGTTHQEENYAASRKLKETARLQFSINMAQMSSLSIEDVLKPGIEISNPFISDAWSELLAGLSETYENITNSRNAIVFTVQNENEYNVQKRIAVSPCTKYDINPFVEVAENMEVNYIVQVEITGQLEHEQVEADEIQDVLKDMTILRNKDNFTVIAEATAKLIMTYGVSSGVEATESPVLDCRSRFIQFSASIANLEELATNVFNSTQPGRVFQVAPKLEFINNSTTIQEDHYEVAKEITEYAKFEFPKEFDQISSINVDDEVKPELEKSIPFLSNIWAQLKGGLLANRSNWNQTVSYRVQNTREFRFQKSIVQASCMKYEVSSFIKMEDGVAFNYRVLLEVTAKLGSDPVRVDEIRRNLKGMIFLHAKNEYTVVVETTMKLKLSYGHSSGVEAVGTQMRDCLEIQAVLVENCKFTCSS